MKRALLLSGATDLGSPNFSGDMLWRTKFRAPDAFWLAEINGRTFVLVSALEYGRVKKQAHAGEAVLLERQRGEGTISAITDFLRRKKVTHIAIPESFPYAAGCALKKSFRVDTRTAPFFPERAIKTKLEIGEMVKVQRAAERAPPRTPQAEHSAFLFVMIFLILSKSCTAGKGMN